MGPSRTIKDLQTSSTESRGTLYQWSHAHDWVQRARAYDLHQAQLKYEEHKKRVKVMNDRHLAASKALQSKVISRINKMSETDIDPADVVTWLEKLIVIERRALGEPEIIEEKRLRDEANSDPRDRLESLIARIASSGGEEGVDPEPSSG